MYYIIYAVGVVVAYWAVTRHFAWFMRNRGSSEESIKRYRRKMKLEFIGFSLGSWISVAACFIVYMLEMLMDA